MIETGLRLVVAVLIRHRPIFCVDVSDVVISSLEYSPFYSHRRPAVCRTRSPVSPSSTRIDASPSDVHKSVKRWVELQFI